MTVQFWQISGYEATAEITDEPVAGSPLHSGFNSITGESVWVVWDQVLHRWQEVDPTMPVDGQASRW